MKRLMSCIAIALLYSAGAAASTLSDDTAEGQANFHVDFSGYVPKSCEITSKNTELRFDLTKGEEHERKFAFTTWCNSYGTKATILITPYAFENENADVIPMEYSFKGQSQTLQDKDTVVRFERQINVSNDIDKSDLKKHKLTMTSKPQAGARWGEYNGEMWVSLYHN